MVQPQITSFLDGNATPVGNPGDQSASIHAIVTNPRGVTGTQSSSHDPPRRYSKKSKRITKAERRRERKRTRIPRKCKKGVLSPRSTPKTQSPPTPTPVPPHEHESRLGNDELSGDDSVMFDDRSLTELLMSQPTSSSSPMPSSVTSGGNHTAQLQSQIAAAAIRLEGHAEEKRRLQNQVELLMEEIDTYRKQDQRQKLSIKKLTNANDQLKRDISRYRGMRKFATEDIQASPVDKSHEQLDLVNAKLLSLREHVASVATSLISAIETDGDTIQTDSRIFTNASTRGTERQVIRTTLSSEPTQGEPIPVVTSCVNRPSAISGSYAEAVQRTPAPRVQRTQRTTRSPRCSQTYVIGTSLTRGLGEQLHKLGADATSFTYAGTRIPHIRSRIPHAIPRTAQPTNVMLQCGGNDVERVPVSAIKEQYEGLIRDVRNHCPHARIVLSTIPPRRTNDKVLQNIIRVNNYLRERGTHNDGVTTIDVVPQDPDHFKKDKVHFNGKGLRLYAANIAKHLSNFTRSRLYEEL